MKSTQKNRNIEKLIIAKSTLESIQRDLLAKSYSSFEQQIKAPIFDKLSIWLSQEFPQLLEDEIELKQGVLRRLKNDIKKNKETTIPFDLNARGHKYLLVECDASLPTEKNIKNNLGLTKAEFKKLVLRLQEGEETLIEKAYLLHFEKCVAVVAKHTSCTQALAYEAVMDALIEIRSDLQKDRIRYGNLESYFTSRAVNKFYKRNKKKKIKTGPLVEGLEFIDDTAQKDRLVEKELNQIVRQGIEKLGRECQEILHLFYYQDLKMTEIGEQLNKSHEAVRKQASRCRGKLKKYFGKDFYKQFSTLFS